MFADIFDALTRHSLYLERVKNWQLAEAQKMLRQHERSIRALVTGAGDFETMDAVTYRRLIKRLDRLQNKFFKEFGSRYMSQLRSLSDADITVQNKIFQSILGKSAKLDPKTVWDKVRNSDVPSDAVPIKKMMEQTIADAKRQIEVAVKQGYIDRKKSTEVLDDVFGNEAVKGKNGAFRRIRNNINSTIVTAGQHVSSAVTREFSDGLNTVDIWSSVIDNVTSDICRSRNGQLYNSGEGPWPPAHRHCRSKRIPWGTDRDSGLPTLPAWLRNQPREVLNDIFGDDMVESILQTSTSSDKKNNWRNLPPMTPDQFKLTINNILRQDA